MDALQILLEGEKVDLLVFVSIAGSIVEFTGVVHQVGRAGDIEDIPLRRLHLFESQGRFATAGGADDDQRWLKGVDIALFFIERDDLVQQIESGVVGIDIDQRLRLRLFQGVHRWDLGLIDHHTTIEKA